MGLKLKSKVNQKEVKKISKEMKTLSDDCGFNLTVFKNRLSGSMDNLLEDLEEKFKESKDL